MVFMKDEGVTGPGISDVIRSLHHLYSGEHEAAMGYPPQGIPTISAAPSP
jgi:hypothetical protein